LDARSELYADTEYLMGFTLSDEGLQVILDRDVPATVKANIRRSVLGFLESRQLALDEIRFMLLHPGGRKLIDHIQTELELAPEMTALTRSVLRDHGNMSSATILYVMDRFLKNEAPELPNGSEGLIAAMGPGFSVEQLHVRWQSEAA
jgi:alkylresorcinol/alkylpyrone synthase